MRGRLGSWAIAVLGAYVVVAVLVALLLFARGPRLVQQQTESLDSDLEHGYALGAFSAALRDQDENSEANRVERRREVQRELLGPIVPVDCARTKRVCVKPENCKLFCKDASVIPFDCDQGVCVERQVNPNRPGGGDGGDDDEAPCDKRSGEYGLLVGYNELGVAVWECVQLYPGWQDKSRYCEGGTVDIDARVRTPSYRDCLCPSGTQRMVYKRSVLGQVAYGLPHCVPDDRVKFYTLSYEVR